MEVSSEPCPACGVDLSHPFARVPGESARSRGPWNLVSCGGCASVYLRPRPAAPAELYAPGYHVHRRGNRVAVSLKSALAARAARGLARRLPAGARLVELGCGTGDLLHALACRGLAVRGVELSPSAVAVARARGLEVTCGDYTKHGAMDASQDAVLASHVLEHVIDPAGFLGEVRRLLKPGGLAFVNTPLAAGWDTRVFGGFSGSYDVPYHMFVPSRAALRSLALAAGLVLVRLEEDPVPNDWVHGLRRRIGAMTGASLAFISPYNPFFALPFLPLSAVAAWCGRAGRARWLLRRPQIEGQPGSAGGEPIEGAEQDAGGLQADRGGMRP